MVSSSSPTLQQLRRLDKSSLDFGGQLNNILYGEEYVQCVLNLTEDDAAWLANYLDKALDALDPSDATSRKCLRELRNICGTKGILPESYTLSSHLLDIRDEPFASGGHGEVYKGTHNGTPVCIKRLRVYAKDGLEKVMKAFCHEAVTWKRVTHPNIVPLLGVTISPRFQLISDYMSGGDLPEYIKHHSDADRLGLLSDVAKGLHYLHSCNVIHGDLKGSNILVDSSDHARIADFGLAMVTKNLDSVPSASHHHGYTPRWTAPEVLKDGKYSKEADIFSFAMVMYEVFAGAVPFSDSSSFMAMLHTTEGKRPPRPTHPIFTEKLWSLMQRCWAHDPGSRPEVSEALQIFLNLDTPAWKQLITHTLTVERRVSLITAIFSDHDQVKMVRNLSGGDAQTFVDDVYEVLDELVPQIHGKCLRYLHRICGRHALLPRSLEIPLCYDPTKDPVSHGGLADVWKGKYQGECVAAQVFRIWPGDDTEKIKRRFCGEVVTWKVLHHPNVLPLLGVTVTNNRLVTVSEWMAKGNIKEFIETDTKVDRLELLRGVTRGLIYMHDQRIIHGDLKGVNILIDDDGHPRIAGFDLVAIATERPTMTPPPPVGGEIPWMSPELLFPEKFDLKKNNPTKQSDCYALGMVIYEVLSGQAPFAAYREVEIVRMVLDGERPERPRGDEGKLFTDEIWKVLRFCWEQRPGDRLSAKVILMGLDGNLPPSRPPSDIDEDVETDTDDQQDEPGPTIAPGDDGLAARPRRIGTKGRRFSDAVRGVTKFFRR